MLNILCGSIPVDGGKILMNGKDITNKKEFKRNRNIGRVYQNPSMGNLPVDDHSGEYDLWQIIKENSLDLVQESIRREEKSTGKC